MDYIVPTRMYEVQYYDGAWMSLSGPMSMESCKAIKRFMESGESNLVTFRILYVG